MILHKSAVLKTLCKVCRVLCFGKCRVCLQIQSNHGSGTFAKAGCHFGLSSPNRTFLSVCADLTSSSDGSFVNILKTSNKFVEYQDFRSMETLSFILSLSNLGRKQTVDYSE